MHDPAPISQAFSVWHLLILMGVFSLLIFGRGRFGR
jgi:Sec-independent protein translocase protein TatA